MKLAVLLFLVAFVLEVQASFFRKCCRCRKRKTSYSDGDVVMISSAVVNERTALNGVPDSGGISDDVIPDGCEDSNIGSIRSDRTGQAESENDITLAEDPRRRQQTRTGQQGCVTTKRNGALVLRDTSNSAPAVQIGGTGTVVPNVPKKSLVPGVEDAVLKKLGALINRGKYEEVIKFADSIDRDEFLMYVCLVVTTIDHFKGLFGHLEQREMIPDFLAHGEMVLVRKVIIETDLLETKVALGWCNDIYDAIVLSLNDNRHVRVASLFEAAHGRHDWKDKFDLFVNGFLNRYPPVKVSMPLKRFFALHGEELSKKHPAIFGTICQESVWKSRRQLDNPGSQKLLIDLVGQPSLLTPVACAKGFLDYSDDASRVNFIKYGYKETIEEGLKEDYHGGGKDLWAVLASTFPSQFSGEYPDTDKARSLALKDLPTKQDLEEEWAKRNAPNLLMKLEMLVPDLLPTVLLGIVSEYAVTWIAFSWTFPQNQLRPQISEHVAEKLKALMGEKRYGEIVELGNSMEKDVLAKHLCPLMTTTEHYMYFNGYLNSRDMIPSFLILGEMGIVRKAIFEIENTDSDYRISYEHIWDAITLSIKEHRDNRAISLLRIERERHATADEWCKLVGKTPQFEVLLIDFSERLIENENTAPLKRFLTINKEELDEGWPNILEIMCQGTVCCLVAMLSRPAYEKLLTDFVGQPSLITTTAFANGFLEYNTDFRRSDFIKYGWREAIQESLKEKYPNGGRKLWAVMGDEYPYQFSRAYPSTDEARTAALKSLPTKQDREEEWAKKNAPDFQVKVLARLNQYLDFIPSTLVAIIDDYATISATWLDVEK